MKKDVCVSNLALNIFELKQLPIFKVQTHRWLKFQDKQKFLPLFRSLTYQNKTVMSKIFIFKVSQQKKQSTIKRRCTIITQKQIISLQNLYQILNQNMSHADFNQQVQKIKQFQKQTTQYINSKLHQNYIKYKKHNFLTFNIYKQDQSYMIKANINNFYYQLQYYENKDKLNRPKAYIIQNQLVKNVLADKLKEILQNVQKLKINEDVNKLYMNFYDKIYFQCDQYHLKLQIYQNHPILRLKNFIPIKFNDKKTNELLTGPIFASTDPECMYAHFSGYNANTTKQLQGTICETCMLPIDSFQQFQLMAMLRDNVLNPERKDMIYCPQHNRFKFYKNIIIKLQKEDEQQQDNSYQKTIIDYLNYYHFKINFKKITNKNRQKFIPKKAQQSFSLICKLYNRQFLIMDPARGKNCQHFAFTDLRLYYLSYNPKSNLYTCPIAQCNEQFTQNDLLYLRQTQILMQYANFKLQQCSQLMHTAKVIIDNSSKKVHVQYKMRDGEKPIEYKKDELINYYKSLQDPYIPFNSYGLGIKQKQRQEKMNSYMFGGWKQQMQEQMQFKQQSQEQDN